MNYLRTLIITVCIPFMGIAQVAEDSQLFTTLQKLDQSLFEDGFNNCNMDMFESYLSSNLEFYHDKGGITDSKEVFIKSFGENMCDQNKKPIRKLVAGSLSVFPLNDNGILYGAIQKGIHEFFIQEPGKKLYKVEVSRFTHVWLKEGEDWKLSRALSYDHKQPKPEAQEITVSEKLLATYAGNYKAPQTGDVVITVTNGVMHLSAGKMQADLVAKSDVLFSHPQAPFALEFVTGKDGSIEKFLVREKGTIVEEAIRVQ